MIREETDPENMISRGTQITLYLRVPYSLFISQTFGHFACDIVVCWAMEMYPAIYLCLDDRRIYFFLQPDDKYEFSEPAKIQSLVKNYSQFVSFPIYTWQEKSRTVEVCFLLLTNHFPLL